jgi:hypothetical protein
MGLYYNVDPLRLALVTIHLHLFVHEANKRLNPIQDGLKSVVWIAGLPAAWFLSRQQQTKPATGGQLFLSESDRKNKSPSPGLW